MTKTIAREELRDAIEAGEVTVVEALPSQVEGKQDWRDAGFPLEHGAPIPA
jgi:hypothetical protein